MKLGIVADIHEDLPRLALALQHFRQQGVEQVVVLGDVFDTGRRLQETVGLLAEARAVGVWRNHDLGLCHEPEQSLRERYGGPVLDFLGTLVPRLELAGSPTEPCRNTPSRARSASPWSGMRKTTR